MKKKLIGLVAGFTLATVALTACEGTGTALSKVEDVYGMSAITSVKLLGSELSAQAVASLSTVQALEGSGNGQENGGQEQSGVVSEAERFHKYFSMLDSFLGEELIKTETEKNTNGAYAEYEHKLTITGKDFEGNDVVHVMYYSETLVEDFTKEKDKDDDDSEVEKKYRLEGVMTMNGFDYTLWGEREEEEEKGETEVEITLRAYLSDDDPNTYVQVEQSTSNEENETEREYVYSVFKGGDLVEQTAVEFETEVKNRKTESEYELEFLSGEGRGKYEIDREERDGQISIKVSYRVNGESGVFHVRELTEEDGAKTYRYSFSNGTELDFSV